MNGDGGGGGSKLVIYACAKVPMGFTLISLRKFAALVNVSTKFQ